METLFRAIETTAIIDDERHLSLDTPLPEKANGRVRLIILFAGDGEIPEQEWLRAMSTNPVFSFLHDPRENIYSVSDGAPFHDEG